MNTNRSFMETNFEYDGDPNTFLKGPKGSTCRDMSSGTLFRKTTGDGLKTGWIPETFGFVEVTDVDYTVKVGDRFLYIAATEAPVEITLPALINGYQLTLFCGAEDNGVTVVGTGFEENLDSGDCIDIIYNDAWILYRRTAAP